MSFQLSLDGKPQCVAALVTFRDEAGKTYVILGRPDPRYRDWSGESLAGRKLPVGCWQFFGGNAEYDPSQPRDYWGEDDPQLPGWPEQLVGDSSRPLNKRIARNALKELAEESNISAGSFNAVPPLRGLMKKAALHYICGQESANQWQKKQDTHFLHLDLGQLSAIQIAALKETVHPGDDMIQSIIIPADKIYRDERNHLVLRVPDGICSYKVDFDGFPEMAQWDERLALRIEEAPTETEKQRLRERRENYHKMDQQLRGLDGIDEASLYFTDFIGMLFASCQRNNNSEILRQSLSLTPALKPPPAPDHTSLARRSPASDTLEV